MEEDEVSKQLREYLRMGYIRYNKSSLGEPILLVKTKEPTWHMYINYGRLNKVTIMEWKWCRLTIIMATTLYIH